MESKVFELRDRITFIPILAIKMIENSSSKQRYLLRRGGYTPTGNSVMITSLYGNKMATANPFDWDDRTFSVAHHYILKNFDKLKDGDVVDVEFILGEVGKPKKSEEEEFEG